jgi:hypothetical protein
LSLRLRQEVQALPREVRLGNNIKYLPVCRSWFCLKSPLGVELVSIRVVLADFGAPRMDGARYLEDGRLIIEPGYVAVAEDL